MKQNMPKLWIFFFLLMVFLVVGLVVTTPKAQDAATVEESEETQDEITRSQTFENMLATGKDAVFVENQQSDQREIWVGYAVLSKPGFVVIYSDDDGVPGTAIGDSGWLEEGGEHVKVQVEEDLKKGDVYYAVLYHDESDKEFSEIHDQQALDSAGSVVLMTFEAIENAMNETEPVLP
jgi:hypothetical protein